MSTSPIGLGVCNKSLGKAGHWWLTPVILAVQETEIRRIMVQSQPGQIVRKRLSQKIHHTHNRAGRVAQGEGSEFKPQYCIKKLGRKG
jgi:hypothetical protein